MSCGGADSGSIPDLDFEGRMSEELSRIASEFLREYLQQNPHAQFHPVQCPSRAHDIVEDSEETAAEFVNQIQQLQSRGLISSDRIEITEPTSLIIHRKGRPVQFLAGFRQRDSSRAFRYSRLRFGR